MASVLVSESGGTQLTVDDGRWVVRSAHGSQDAEAVLVALLPLLEREPEAAIEMCARSTARRFHGRRSFSRH